MKAIDSILQSQYSTVKQQEKEPHIVPMIKGLEIERTKVLKRIQEQDAKIVANDSGARYGVMNGGWDKLLTERDIDSIVAYIKSLKK